MSDVSVSASADVAASGVDNRKLGVWTFLGSEVVFFSSLIVTYVIMSGRAVSGPTPGQALSISLVAANTFVLICSSLTMVSALASIQKGDQRGLRLWLLATALLGLAFLAGQGFEFVTLYRQGLTLRSSLFGASFFTLTGFHGGHVAIGVIAICFVLVRALTGGVTQSNHLAVELVGLYWHFVDVVWIVIFTLVYLLGT